MNDARGPGLPLLMAVCIALLVGGALAVTWWRQPSPDALRERLRPPSPPSQPDASGPRTFRSRSPRLSMPLRLPADERVAEIERDLEQARAQIARLEEFRARYRARFPAEADIDWSSALDALSRDARALLSDEPGLQDDASVAESAETAPPATAPNSGAAADLDRRVRDLQSRLEIAQFLDEEQRLENEQLRANLAEAAATLTRETERARGQAEQLEGERLLVDEASRRLIALGASAVPGLVDALDSDEAYVREWAADVLGAMGAAAGAALPDLMDATSDPDPDARAAIRRAIDAIERADP